MILRRSLSALTFLSALCVDDIRAEVEDGFNQRQGSSDVAIDDARWRSGFYLRGLNDQVYEVAVHDGKLIVAGWFTGAGPIGANHLAAWDGETWSALGTGIRGGDGVPRTLTSYGGELIAGGQFDEAGGVPVNSVAAWDGSGWHTLGSGITGVVLALAEYNGHLIAGGQFTAADGKPASGLASWDGTSWNPMGSGVTRPSGSFAEVRALAVYDGRLIIGGTFSHVDGVAALNVAAWDGATWSAVGSGFGGTVEALTVYDGALIAGGVFHTAGPVYVGSIARWDGAAWGPLSTGLRRGASGGLVLALAVHDGLLYAGGSFLSAGDKPAECIAQWDGMEWAPLGPGFQNGREGYPAFVNALAFFDGYLYAGGVFTFAGDLFSRCIARWANGTWDGLDPPGHGIPNRILSLCDFAGGVAAGGSLYSTDNSPWDNIALWDGTEWHSLGLGTNNGVHEVLEFQGDLIAGGRFTEAGGLPASHIARWDGSGWHALGSGLDGDVWCLVAYQGKLVAGGVFQHAGSLEVGRVAVWDGVSWAPLGAGLNDAVLSLIVHDGELVAGGNFYRSGAQELSGIARWDGTEWQTIGPGFNSSVRTLANYGGDLIAAGTFTHIAYGRAIGAVARWDGEAWQPVGRGNAGPEINALAVLNGALFIGGLFNIGSLSPWGIARWDGTEWQPLGSGTNNVVDALLASGNSLIVGGAFGMAGNKPSVGYAIWDSPVAIEVEDFGAMRNEEGIALSWKLSRGAREALAGISVERATAELGPYQPVGAFMTSELHEVMRFLDRSAEPASGYWYRLALRFGSGATSHAGPILASNADSFGFGTSLSAPTISGGGGAIVIRYSIDRPGTPVVLAIHDARGRLIRTLERSVQGTGKYSRLWERIDAKGRSVATGVYFVRLEAGRFRVARKLLVP